MVMNSMAETCQSRLTSAATQRKIVLPGELTLCAMTTVAGARDRLPGHNEDDVLALIEETGGLTWAWNIGLIPSRGSAAREIRILTKCIEHFVSTGKGLDWTFEQVLRRVLRGFNKPFITGTRLQIIMNCSSTHVINLIVDGALRVVPGTSWNEGPAGSPLVVTESFVRFLEARKIL
jgi:hypothetical protein